MSSEGFKNIPGVPEGWELLAVGLVTMGEWFVNRNGDPERWNQDFPTTCMYAIIRKIEVPNQYRPFKGGAEYMASSQRGVAVNWKDPNTPCGFYAVVSANASFVWVAFGDKIERFDWKQAFEKLVCRHADGSTSPFGVEVKE
jgi:hypothetical protein